MSMRYQDWKSEIEKVKDAIDSAEPTVNFTTEGGVVVFSIKSSGVFYNRDEFPKDTTEQAARRVYEMIKPVSSWITQPDLKWSLSEWRENPRREFVINKNGITHNYDLDVWHHWFMEHLNRLVKRPPS